jgi:hypothetical protein
MPRELKIVLIAFGIGLVVAAGIAYVGKTSFDEREYGTIR